MLVHELTLDQALAEIARLESQIAEYKRKGSEWRERALAAEKRVKEIEEILANKNLSSAQALTLYSATKAYDAGKKRPDGSVYVSYETLAEPIPISGQAAGDALLILNRNGILPVVEERKKHGAGKNLFLAPIPIQTRMNLAHVVIDNVKNPRAGGKRIAIHKVCGGECIERTKYLCRGCGVDNISPQDVLLVNEETWRRQQEGIETEQTYLANRAAREGKKLMDYLPATPAPEPVSEETERRPAVPKTPRVPVTQATLASLAPASAPAEPILLRPLPPFPDRPCEHCGRPQRVCFAMSPAGVWDFTCTRDMWIA